VRLALGAHDHVLVSGPARSGRTTLLDALARGARRADVDVVRIGTARHAAPGTVHERDAIVAVIDALLAGGRAATPVLVLVDDADVVDDGGALDRLLAAPHHVAHVVASVRDDRVRGLFRHWTGEVRRGGIGVLLRAEEADGEVLGVRLPRTRTRRTAGRGWLVQHGACELVQFARTGAPAGDQTS
jgi:S-DNA-T family DNA segregation ATPase FtsK/SpoIIIE